MVWAGTSEVGCAKVSFEQSSDDVEYAVCRYATPGNEVGKYAENVNCLKTGCPPPSIGPPVSCLKLQITLGSQAYLDLVAYNEQRLAEHNRLRGEEDDSDTQHQDILDLEFDLDLAC